MGENVGLPLSQSSKTFFSWLAVALRLTHSPSRFIFGQVF
jgi:hypothetical protein